MRQFQVISAENFFLGSCHERAEDYTRWTLDAGRWTLDAGRWTLDAGRWTLDAGLRLYGVSLRTAQIPA